MVSLTLLPLLLHISSSESGCRLVEEVHFDRLLDLPWYLDFSVGGGGGGGFGSSSRIASLLVLQGLQLRSRVGHHPMGPWSIKRVVTTYVPPLLYDWKATSASRNGDRT